MDQETYLQKLGITRWSLQAPVRDESVFKINRCYRYQVAESALILSMIDQPSTQAQALQEAILDAMKQRYQGGYLEQLTLADCFSSKVVLLMGHKTAEAYLQRSVNFTEESSRWLAHQDQQVMITYGLDDLLKDKSLKKQAWSDIQLMMKAL